MMRFLKKARRSNARVGVAYGAVHTAYAMVDRQGEARQRLRAHAVAALADDEGAAQLSQRPDDIAANLPAVGVLDPADYRLQLTELPAVPAEEMRAALRWQAKDMIDYPPEEAVVDYVAIPPHVNAAGKRLGYVLVARQAVVRQCLEQLIAGGFEPGPVSVAEIGLHNLARLLPQEKYGVALLHFERDSGCLLISREGVLHLIRRLNTGTRRIADSLADDFSTREMASGLALEIQRSLDYYESHYDCRPITDLVMTPAEGAGPLPELLKDNLGLDVSWLDFNEHFDCGGALDNATQAACAAAIGAALRGAEDEQAAAGEQLVDLTPPQAAKDTPRFSAAFLAQSAAAGVAAMALLGVFASSRVESLRQEVEFSQRQEEVAIRHLAEASETIRHAVGAESWDARRETLTLTLREKQAMLQLLRGQKLGETGGFSPHLRALSESDIDGIWLTRITVDADAQNTLLEGLASEAELVPAYIQLLTAEAPFAEQGFQVFRIDRPERPAEPLAFALAGTAAALDAAEDLR